MKLLRISLTVLTLVAWAAAAQAGPITSVTSDDCDADGCAGSKLFLSVEDEGGGSWLVTYRINTDDYVGDRTGFNQIGFKAVSGWTDAALISADPGLAGWSDPAEAPINSNSSCSNSKGNSSKVCVHGYVDTSGGGDYTWQFRLTDGELLDTSEWHLGAQYANGEGTARGKIISTNAVPGAGAPVPEPSGAILFGVGLFVLRSARRQQG